MQSSSSASMSNSETVIYTRLASRNSTHGQLVSNSVGMAMHMLMNCYLSDSVDEELLYTRSIATLSALLPASFFKSDDDLEAPHNKALYEEIAASWGLFVEFLETKAAEPPVIEYDKVTLYLPNQAGGFQEEERMLLLKLAIALLVQAIMDDAKAIGQSVDDRPLRLQSLFYCLKRIKNGICHTGVRHELIMLLNGTYKGINIIVDGSATVQSVVRNHVYEAFDQWVTIKKDLAIVRDAFFFWMTNGNAMPLIEYFGCKAPLIQELRQLFIAHGTNPDNLASASSFEAFFDTTCSELPFTYTPAHNVFQYIKLILNPNAMSSNQPERDAALQVMNVWLRDHYCFERSQDILIGSFYSAYLSYQQLLQYKNLLLISGAMPLEEIQRHNNLCVNYFTQRE